MKTKRSIRTRKFATSGQLKHSFQIPRVWALHKMADLMLMSTFVFTGISNLCLCLCLRRYWKRSLTCSSHRSVFAERVTVMENSGAHIYFSKTTINLLERNSMEPESAHFSIRWKSNNKEAYPCLNPSHLITHAMSSNFFDASVVRTKNNSFFAIRSVYTSAYFVLENNKCMWFTCSESELTLLYCRHFLSKSPAISYLLDWNKTSHENLKSTGYPRATLQCK